MTPQTPTAPPERFNFAQHLIERNATRGAKAAYIDDAETLTYAALADRVQRCARLACMHSACAARSGCCC